MRMMKSRKQSLNLFVDRSVVFKLLQVGNEFDLQKDGLYDARSGIVNIWASPDDKPACWYGEITQGGLNYPRDYVGALGWDYIDDNEYELYIEASPFSLFERNGRTVRKELTEEEWSEIFRWVKEKAEMLIRLTTIQPKIVGTQCPFCDFVLPTDALLNELFEHIHLDHSEIEVKSFVMPDILITDKGEFRLKSVESFED
jgi:hypothetical protein